MSQSSVFQSQSLPIPRPQRHRCSPGTSQLPVSVRWMWKVRKCRVYKSCSVMYVFYSLCIQTQLFHWCHITLSCHMKQSQRCQRGAFHLPCDFCLCSRWFVLANCTHDCVFLRLGGDDWWWSHLAFHTHGSKTGSRRLLTFEFILFILSFWLPD